MIEIFLKQNISLIIMIKQITLSFIHNFKNNYYWNTSFNSSSGQHTLSIFYEHKYMLFFVVYDDEWNAWNMKLHMNKKILFYGYSMLLPHNMVGNYSLEFICMALRQLPRFWNSFYEFEEKSFKNGVMEEIVI